jgi:hypothetical protein
MRQQKISRMCIVVIHGVLCVICNGISADRIYFNYHRFCFHPRSYTHTSKQFIQENIHLMHKYTSITVWYKSHQYENVYSQKAEIL